MDAGATGWVPLSAPCHPGRVIDAIRNARCRTGPGGLRTSGLEQGRAASRVETSNRSYYSIALSKQKYRFDEVMSASGSAAASHSNLPNLVPPHVQVPRSCQEIAASRTLKLHSRHNRMGSNAFRGEAPAAVAAASFALELITIMAD